MKKLLLVLLAGVVLILLFTYVALADYHKGDTCPRCGNDTLFISAGDPTDDWHEVFCTYRSDTGASCGFRTLEYHYGGNPSCANEDKCEACGTYYYDPDNHVGGTHYVDRIEPICVRQGYEPGYVCNSCNRYVEGGKEIPRDRDKHEWGPWTKADETSHICYCEYDCGATKTEAHYDQFESLCEHQPHCEYCDQDYGTVKPHEMWYEDRGENGHKPYCYNCDTQFDVEAHTGGAATCTERAVCEVCKAEYGAAPSHELRPTTKVDPTCTQTGTEAYWTCQRDGCGKMFSDDRGVNEIKEPAVIPPKGHTEVPAPAVQATCTAPGRTQGKRCSDCGAVLSGQKATKALGHWFPEWQSNGNDAHSAQCARCGWTMTVGCALISLPQADSDTEPEHACPVCGYRERNEAMEKVEDAVAEGELPDGFLFVFVARDAEDGYLTVCFEKGGRPVQPGSGSITLILPAELLDGHSIVLSDPDGSETAVEEAVNDGKARVTLGFRSGGTPALVLRLVKQG